MLVDEEMISLKDQFENTNVFVSARFLRVSNPTGTQRSARKWLLHTLASFRGRASVCIPLGIDYKIASSSVQVLPCIDNKTLGGDHRWEQLVFPALQRDGVLWTLMGTGPIFKRGNRHVMLMHDINFILIPHAFSWKFRLWYRFASVFAAKRANRIVCFTEYVKQTLIERVGIDEKIIKVIPQGPGLDGLEGLTKIKSWNMKTPYFLCVGSLQPHKNLALVLAVWEEFVQRFPDFKLRIVGRKQDRFSKLPFEPEKLRLPGVEFTGYINDSELIASYQGALGFVYPSLEEGFGLPVVEAFYCGCPVITSNVSCLPEVAGDAAILIDPSDTKSLLEAMCLLAENQVERDRLRARGYVRAQDFRWSEAGRRMAEVLHEVVCNE